MPADGAYYCPDHEVYGSGARCWVDGRHSRSLVRHRPPDSVRWINWPTPTSQGVANGPLPENAAPVST